MIKLSNYKKWILFWIVLLMIPAYAIARTVISGHEYGASDLAPEATIGGAYIYRQGGTDVADADVVDTLTISNLSQVQDVTASAASVNAVDDGTTAQIPVGGGPGSAMVWTTAQGSGAPVRAVSPTLTGTVEVGTTAAGGNENIQATLGAELAPALTGATGVNWTFAGTYTTPLAGTIEKAGAGTNTITPTAATSIVAGTTYKVVLTFSAFTAGSASYTLGGVTGTSLSAATTYTDHITAATTGKFILTPASDATRFVCTVVSFKALTDATGDFTVYGNLKLGSPIQNIKGTNAITIGPTGNVGIGAVNYLGGLLTVRPSTAGGGIVVRESDDDYNGVQILGYGTQGRIFLISSNVNKIDLNPGGDSFFNNGNTAFGTTTPDARLHAELDSATTNAAVEVGRIAVTSSGTPAAGLGPELTFETETAAGSPGNMEIGGGISVVATDVTSTNEDFDFVFKAMAGGATRTEVARISSTGAVTATSFEADRSATPGYTFGDSDGAVSDTNGWIYGTLTDTGDGTEDFDMYFQQQIAGNLTTFLYADADGDVNVRNRTFNIGQYSADAVGPYEALTKSRHATVGSHTIVQDDDVIGGIDFKPSDGTDFGTISAQIKAEVDDAAPAASSIGGALVFSTAAGAAGDDLTERMRIDKDGNTTITGSVTGIGLVSGTAGTVAGNVTLHDAGAMTFYDDGNDTSVAVGPVTDGTTTLGITGTVSATALQEGANAVPNATDHLGFFAATTSAQLAGVLSDETGGAGVAVFSTAPTLTDPILNTTTALASDDTYTGFRVVTGTAGENLTQWDLLYRKDDGTGVMKYYQYNPDSTDADRIYLPCGIALAAISAAASGNIGLNWGIVRNDGWGFTDNQDEGVTLYADDVAGAITITPPADSGDYIRVVGIMQEENTVEFNFAMAAIHLEVN